MSRLYTKMKVFHFKEKVDSLPIDRPEILPPIHIRIKPTNVCNHNCRYCAYRTDNLQLGKDMNRRDFIARDKMLEIIHDIIDMGVKAVTFSGGGEPLVYPHITEAALTLAASGVKIATLTNGANLTGETAEVFAHTATWVRVSMDGYDDESYSRYRGVKHGEFTKIMGNLRDFKKHDDKCYLGVSFIIDKDNCHKVYEFTEKLRDVGVDSVKVSPCIVSNDGAQNNAYHKPFFALVKEQTAKAKEDFCNDKNFEIFDSYHALDEKFKKDYSWCPYLQILPVIGADCNVYSCQDKAYNLEEGLVGSVRGNVRFRDFWFSDKSKFFKTDPSKVCNHHCVANEKNTLVHDYLEANMEHLGFV